MREVQRSHQSSSLPLASQRILAHVLEHLEALAGCCDAFIFRPGQVIFYAGHMPYGFYRIKKGTVQLMPAVATQGPSETLTALPLVAPPPFILGLDSIIAQTPFDHTCQALSEVEAEFYSKSVVMQFVTELAGS